MTPPTVLPEDAERARLLRALSAERAQLGVLAPRPIWLLGAARALRLIPEHDIALEPDEAASVSGWLPPFCDAESSPDAAIAALLAHLNAHLASMRPAAPPTAARWWRRSALSGALHPADAPTAHAPLDGLIHRALDAQEPVWQHEHGTLRCAWPWLHSEAAGVLEVTAAPDAPPSMWETVRRAAERLGAEELRRAHHRIAARDRRFLDAVLRVTHDGIIGGSADGHISIYAPRLEAMVGWTRAEIDDGAWPHRVYPDPAVRARMIENIRAHFDELHFEGHEVELSTRSGDTIPCRLRTANTTDEHDQVVVLGAFQDITRARNEAVRAHQQANINALGHLAATIAHDFRNLLALVGGHAAVLEAAVSGDARARAGRIRATAERGGALARRLLTFGSARPVALRPVDLVAELERALEPLRGSPNGPDLRAPARASWVHADANLLQEVLDNLLSNAIAAQGGAAGGLRLTVDCEPPPPLLAFSALEPHRSLLHLSIEDTGPGFSAESRAHLFEPFFSTNAAGHGLGLASVRQLVGLMCGAIDVPPTPTGGRVDLWLPQSGRPPSGAPTAPAGPPTGREHIWVLDDEEDIGEIVSCMLTELGYTIRAFSEADAFVAAVECEPLPDAFMLDLHIGRRSGLRLLEELRARGLRQPALLCTGGVPPDLRDPRARLLEKPFDQYRLAEAIRALFDHMVFAPVRSHPGL